MSNEIDKKLEEIEKMKKELAEMKLTKTKKQWKDFSLGRKIMTVIVGIIWIIIIVGLFKKCTRPLTPQEIAEKVTEEKSEKLGNARWRCQTAVRDNLKNPEEAVFGDSRLIISDDNKTFKVYTEVTATNSFNAKIKSVFKCSGVYLEDDVPLVKKVREARD
jgi:cell division protein FtsL